jgi:adenylosuccinate synthase
MNSAKVVIGAAYGDEGKGVFTDYLSSKTNESMVVRFNGGAQAGHTVLTPSGDRHIFGHFASNSFLPNSKTVLSDFFVVNPLLFAKEEKVLNNFNIYPEVFINENAYITTPFEMILNQWIEDSRGKNRHGSCGVGFGETVEREEVAKVSLKMKDVFTDDFNFKLLEVKENFFKRVETLGLSKFLEDNLFIKDARFLEKFKEDSVSILGSVKMFDKNMPSSENIIFEGAQGLLLDQSFGSFPNVTRSNTGLKNVVQLAKKYNITNLDVIYASRCYTTRHGAGPLKNSLVEKPYPEIVDKTNIPNDYQGSLRFAYLDLDLLKETINKDLVSIKNSETNINWNLGLTCLDQTEIVYFYEEDNLKSIKSKDFNKYIADFLETKVLHSWGGSRNKILDT